MSIGPMEIVLIALIAFLLFGPKRLPEVARTVGRAMAEFRKASKELSDELTAGLEEDKKGESPEFPPPGPRA